MEIRTHYREGEEPRSVEEWKNFLRESFLDYQVFSLEINENLLQQPKDKIQFQALKELVLDGTLSCHNGPNLTTTFFLTEEVSKWKKELNVSYDFCLDLANVYNSIMPTVMPDPSLFVPLKASEVDETIAESVIAILNLTYGNHIETQDTSDEDEGGEENTFTLE